VGSTELYVVGGLVVLSVLGMAWPKIAGWFSGGAGGHTPADFELRMELINQLLDACEGCPDETKAVVTAGDVIAKHWREDAETNSK